MTDLLTTPNTKRRRSMMALGALLGVVAGLAAVYGIGGLQRNPADAACRPAAQLAKRLAPFARGEVAGIAVAAAPDRVPDLAFNDAAGKARALSEWRGRALRC